MNSNNHLYANQHSFIQHHPMQHYQQPPQYAYHQNVMWPAPQPPMPYYPSYAPVMPYAPPFPQPQVMPQPVQLQPTRQPPARVARPMTLMVRVKRRQYQAIVDDSKTATTINRALAEYVLKGPPPLNDVISLPLEINKRHITSSAIVVEQPERIILGKQCLETFGLLVGVVQKPSVHTRLGKRAPHQREHQGRHRKNHQSRPSRQNQRLHSNNRRVRSDEEKFEELKRLMYPGEDEEKDAIEIHASRELMAFDD